MSQHRLDWGFQWRVRDLWNALLLKAGLSLTKLFLEIPHFLHVNLARHNAHTNEWQQGHPRDWHLINKQCLPTKSERMKVVSDYLFQG